MWQKALKTKLLSYKTSFNYVLDVNALFTGLRLIMQRLYVALWV